jgi:hypothetical protein
MEPQRPVAFMAGQRRIPDTPQMGFIARIGQSPREAGSPRRQASSPGICIGDAVRLQGTVCSR